YCSFFSCVLRLPPTSSLFPYTTLFRSLWILESLRILEASRTSLLDDLPSLSSLKPCIPKTTSPSAEYSKATCKLASLSIRERGFTEYAIFVLIIKYCPFLVLRCFTCKIH